jgi:hypothetical protein
MNFVTLSQRANVLSRVTETHIGVKWIATFLCVLCFLWLIKPQFQTMPTIRKQAEQLLNLIDLRRAQGTLLAKGGVKNNFAF